QRDGARSEQLVQITNGHRTKFPSYKGTQLVSRRQQDLFELLQQLAITGEFARGVCLLHIAKHGAGTRKPIEIGASGCWPGGLFNPDPDQKGLRFAKGARPFDLAVVW